MQGKAFCQRRDLISKSFRHRLAYKLSVAHSLARSYRGEDEDEQNIN